MVGLVETSAGGFEEGQDRRYAALSYCWGGTAKTLLTISSRAGFLTRGVDLEELPLTVQDALKVTRELGLKWLWVDSLCIIQDCKDDWLREAGRMADVYRDCEVSIAALGAMSSVQGIFCHRDPLRYASCRLGKGITLLSPYVTGYMARNQGIVWPLETRGWVVQERMLARRTLKFGTYISWECREGIKDEFLCEEGTTHWSSYHWSRKLFELTERGRAVADDQLRETWRKILELYAESSLTVKSDRLVAISGIIQAISRATGYRNIAGLWEQYFVSSLMWTARYFGADSEHRGPRTGLPPSWSWAAVDSMILADGAREMPDADRDVAVRVCTTQEAASFGIVIPDGRHEMPLHFRTLKIDSDLYTLVRKFSDGELERGLKINIPQWPLGAWGRLILDTPVESEEDRERMSLVPLRFQWQPGSVTQYRAGRMMGLVVQPSERCKGAFERAGTWEVDFTRKEGEDLGPFDTMMVEQEGWRDIVLV
ncbi:heterokaryon incompatibility protein-domain-containing protein [Immersiella caudata]|uniref:Heterokaryon incompatibility protein-domain-containing protein n=1 Tax=Immersiella caudata TaxID=314043 RepID=A0AA39WFB0_9PEZI|nr:heterokaryon incompatibility protein-domain-containing protein [Immersiella caudata]